jgi:hypothetical protein
MYDMLKENYLSGSQVLNICTSQLVNETAVDVLTDVMRFVVPVIIKSYLPLEQYESAHKNIFELFLNILKNGTIKDESTQHLVLDAVLTSARCEEHYKLIKVWLETGFIHDLEGNKIEGMEVSKKHKHSILQRLYSSDEIPIEEKEKLMSNLASIDNSDWLDNTKKVCESSLPENKEKMWRLYFSKGKEIEDWGLYHYQNSFRGWN